MAKKVIPVTEENEDWMRGKKTQTKEKDSKGESKKTAGIAAEVVALFTTNPPHPR